MTNRTHCIVMTTTGSLEEAARLAEALVNQKLAACVQMIPMTSCYPWQGKVQVESEQLMLIKTAADLYPQVEVAIIRIHNYEVPEIIRVPMDGGFSGYLGWINENVVPPEE
ncbi:MAG TPA: divalent-cation tolerance protein CutA [Anaerolineaceae bacterium]|nr:divalent-cation tolerance protein CutA [Anaerolineaceae bacterium]